MRIDLNNLAREYKSIKTKANKAMQEVINSSAFIFGKQLMEFEKNFAEFCNVKYSLGADSGTGALEMALRALNIREGDEVIVPTFTFYATAASVCYVGAKPVFVDVEEDTGNMDMDKLESLLETSFKNSSCRIKAIIPVHIFGQPVNMERVMAIAKKYKLLVIEDSAQAHGAEVKIGDKWHIAGSIGELGCFSFYPAKNLGCYGDGGAITTNSDELANSIKLLRDYGRLDKYLHKSIGYNKRLDTLQAAVLIIKLANLRKWNDKRRKFAQMYNRLLKDVSQVKFLTVKDYAKPVFHQFVLKVEDRDNLKNYLAENEIFTGIHYPVPLHLQPSFGFLGYKKGDLPVSEQLGEHVLSIPMHPFLRLKEVKFVADKIKEFYRNTK